MTSNAVQGLDVLRQWRFSAVLEHQAARVRMSLNHAWKVSFIDPEDVETALTATADARRQVTSHHDATHPQELPKLHLVPFLGFHDETRAPRIGTTELLSGFSVGYAATLKRVSMFYSELPPALTHDDYTPSAGSGPATTTAGVAAAVAGAAGGASGKAANTNLANQKKNAAAAEAAAAAKQKAAADTVPDAALAAEDDDDDHIVRLADDDEDDLDAFEHDPAYRERQRLKLWCKRCVQHVLEDSRVTSVDGNKNLRRLRTRTMLSTAQRVVLSGGRHIGFRFKVTYEQRSEASPQTHGIALAVCVNDRGYLILAECVNEDELTGYVNNVLLKTWLNDTRRFELGAVVTGYSECSHAALQVQQQLFGELVFTDNDGAVSFRLPMHPMSLRPDHSPTVPPGPGSLCCVTLELTIHQKLLDALDEDEALAAGGRTRLINVTLFIEIEDLLKEPNFPAVFSGDAYSQRRHENFTTVFRDARVLGLPLAVPIGKRTGRSTTCSFSTILGDHPALVKMTSVTTLVGSHGASCHYFTKLGQGTYDSYLYIYQHVLNTLTFFSERDISGTFSRYRSVPIRILENDLNACYPTTVEDLTARQTALVRHTTALRNATDGEVEGVHDVVYLDDKGKGGELRASAHQTRAQRQEDEEEDGGGAGAKPTHAFSDDIPDESGQQPQQQQQGDENDGGDQAQQQQQEDDQQQHQMNFGDLQLDDEDLDTLISTDDIGRLRDLVDITVDDDEPVITRIDGSALHVPIGGGGAERSATPDRGRKSPGASGRTGSAKEEVSGGDSSAQNIEGGGGGGAAAGGATGVSGEGGVTGVSDTISGDKKASATVSASASIAANEDNSSLFSQHEAAAAAAAGSGATEQQSDTRLATAGGSQQVAAPAGTGDKQQQQQQQPATGEEGGPTKQQLEDLADALALIGADDEEKKRRADEAAEELADGADGKKDLKKKKAPKDGDDEESSANSLRNAYMEICKEEGCRPNSYLVQKLPVIPRLTQTIEALDMSHNYVGRTGFIAILRLLDLLPKVNTVYFNSMSLDNNDVAALCDELIAHRTIHSVFLRNNPRVTLPAAKSLFKLLRENVNVTTVSLTGTGIGLQLQQRIEKEAEANKHYSAELQAATTGGAVPAEDGSSSSPAKQQQRPGSADNKASTSGKVSPLQPDALRATSPPVAVEKVATLEGSKEGQQNEADADAFVVGRKSHTPQPAAAEEEL